MALTFPTLTVQPSGDFSEKPSEAEDSADIRTKSDAGYVITRRRFTRVPNVFTFSYWPLAFEDAGLLRTFIEKVGVSVSFDWIHPVNKTIHHVRFSKRPRLIYRGLHWNTDIELEEV